VILLVVIGDTHLYPSTSLAVGAVADVPRLVLHAAGAAGAAAVAGGMWKIVKESQYIKKIYPDLIHHTLCSLFGSTEECNAIIFLVVTNWVVCFS
jgi:hypothetical protein